MKLNDIGTQQTVYVALLVSRLRRAARTSSGERVNPDNLESVGEEDIFVGIVLSFPDTNGGEIIVEQIC